MLTKIKYFLSQSFIGLRRTFGVTSLSVTIIAMALSILALFWTLLANLEILSGEISREAGISADIDETLSLAKQRELTKEIEKWSNIESASLVTSTSAMEWLRNNLGKEADVLDGLPADLLPSSIEINLSDLATSDVQAVVSRLQKTEGIISVRYGFEDVERISAVLILIRTSMYILGLFLFVSIFLILSNAVRLAVYSRRDEIEVMSLIGGTRSFIVTPFVLEGAIIGFMGGLLCVSFLFMSEEIMTQWFQANLAEVYGPIEIRFLKGTEYVALVVIGTVNSLLGSAYAAVRHVKI
ncbi:MAG: permease-like cell division protein FtsX [Myxococcota bacterium]|nr:permease-like cell division protein FtsX [Myxococcota bacterium]